MSKSLVLPSESLALNSPTAMAEFATTLKMFIVEQKLYTNIVGKNYVHVEGWQFAGAVMGILPHLAYCKKIDRENEVAYEARIQLKTLDGKEVGSAIAICSNKESKKKSFDEYAIASMAQTRATGKAFRLSFGWLMKMAGYEATPAEEMDDQTIEVGGKRVPRPPKKSETTETVIPVSTTKGHVSVSGMIMQKRKENNGA